MNFSVDDQIVQIADSEANRQSATAFILKILHCCTAEHESFPVAVVVAYCCCQDGRVVAGMHVSLHFTLSLL